MTPHGFGEIAERLRRSTVVVHAGRRGSGSGVIWSHDGLLITNAHVARADSLGASRARLAVELWDGRTFEARIVSRDRRRDLAALRIPASGLPAATPADSSRLRPGELAIAVGNPLGFVGALTTGVIHALGPLPGLGPERWVQAAIRLAPGNSGGPLADARGHIIGINTMVAGGLALAIPSNAVAQFITAGPSDIWLGVTLRPVRLPRDDGSTFGLLVLEVEPGSPAASASLLPGDILLGADSQAFRSLEDLAQSLEATGRSGPGLLRLDFLRGSPSNVRRVTVRIGSRSVVAA
ncbi:MAG TPA: trypsin-like peptidase domain-containing protein [Candidatus Acidoferrales bacterium]|nr:trypsin-like peptidase domain-containing protein [Candidatus Acidoferrales bacterium]